MMEYIGSTNFDLVKLPTRETRAAAADCKTISDLLVDIVEFRKKYFESCYLSSTLQSCVRSLTVEFVYKTSVGESVGLQSREDIEAVIKAYTINNTVTNIGAKLSKKDEERNETINIYKALKYAEELREKMKNTGILTVQQICEIHRVLMTGLRKDAGEIRKHHVYTSCKGKIHFYPQPHVAEQILYACVDHHCIQMSRLANSPNELMSASKVELLFKRAARLLFDFVDAHPFADGNGRTCRLLANYVISLITPFPVTPCGEGGNIKDDYLEAIVECRDHRDKGPGALASMLIEDTWRGWKSLFPSINQ